MREAPLLILDEATAYLDPQNSARIKDAIELLARSRSVLLITHSPELAGIANRTLRLAEGRVVEPPRQSESGPISYRSARPRHTTSPVEAQLGATA
jgi:ABC-type transport system involved in cytochrome bd biosynthesis fused ATPase/permease subunit